MLDMEIGKTMFFIVHNIVHCSTYTCIYACIYIYICMYGYIYTVKRKDGMCKLG